MQVSVNVVVTLDDDEQFAIEHEGVERSIGRVHYSPQAGRAHLYPSPLTGPGSGRWWPIVVPDLGADDQVPWVVKRACWDATSTAPTAGA